MKSIQQQQPIIKQFCRLQNQLKQYQQSKEYSILLTSYNTVYALKSDIVHNVKVSYYLLMIEDLIQEVLQNHSDTISTYCLDLALSIIDKKIFSDEIN